MSHKKKKQQISSSGKQIKKKKASKKNNVFFFLFLIIGFSIFAYPFVSNAYYKWLQRQAVELYYQETLGEDEASRTKRKEEMENYNYNLVHANSQDLEMPFTKAQHDTLESGKSHALGEVLAVIDIPKILVNLPVYNGTSDMQLQYGAGLLEGTSMPIGGESSHSVISGHRGLPSAKLFTDLPNLEIGDEFYLHLVDETHAYEVDQIKVVEPTNMQDLLIVPGEDYVTLLTCTPYMLNTHRLLVRGHRVPYNPNKRLNSLREAKRDYYKEVGLFILGALLVILILIWLKKRKKKQKKKQEEMQAAQNALVASEKRKARREKRSNPNRDSSVKNQPTKRKPRKRQSSRLE